MEQELIVKKCESSLSLWFVHLSLDLILRPAAHETEEEGRGRRRGGAGEGRDLVEQRLVELRELVDAGEAEEAQHDRHEGAPQHREGFGGAGAPDGEPSLSSRPERLADRPPRASDSWPGHTPAGAAPSCPDGSRYTQNNGKRVCEEARDELKSSQREERSGSKHLSKIGWETERRYFSAAARE
jgi:hypothetical protein